MSRLEYFVDELETYDDLFFLLLFRGLAFRPATFGEVVYGSHHHVARDTIYDTAKSPSSGGVCNAHDYSSEADQENLRGRAALPSRCI